MTDPTQSPDYDAGQKAGPAREGVDFPPLPPLIPDPLPRVIPPAKGGVA